MRPEAEAQRAIHVHDTERLKQLVTEFPALLSWQGGDDHNGLLGFATGAYGDAFGPEREGWFTRADAAELLIDAGAIVTPSVVEGILDSRAAGLLQLFHRKGLLPRTLNFAAALGDADAVRASVDQDSAAMSEAFVVAANFHHHAIASLLLERSIALDPDLGARLDAGPGRRAFVDFFIDHGAFDRQEAAANGLWKTFVMRQVKCALLDGHLDAFVSGLQREPWLLGDAFVAFQADLIGWAATNNDRGPFISALLDLDPALLRRQPPPPAKPIEWAFEYGHTSLLPLLTRVWPLSDDLPHAAGTGDMARVQQWCADARSTDQRALDTALAYAVINRHFDVADVLLAHGANINTDWNSHEPASILHHVVFLPDNYPMMQYLIDRGIDLTIKDYRWNATAWGWAFYALRNEQMAAWLKDAERRREQKSKAPRSRADL